MNNDRYIFFILKNYFIINFSVLIIPFWFNETIYTPLLVKFRFILCLLLFSFSHKITFPLKSKISTVAFEIACGTIKSNDPLFGFGKILNLKSNDKGALPTHIIRFWETQFKQIKPKILNSNRRYYDEKTINLLKKVKFLLKEQGMTINGVKKILNNEVSLKLDEIADKSIRTENLKNKLLNISNKLKELKNGKKNTR